jgi:uncharacterized protein
VRLVVISDTHLHAAEALPREVLREMEQADLVVHCGDFTGEKVYRFLEERFSLAAVAGNTDCARIREELPDQRVIDCDGRKVGIIHGWGSPLRLAQRVRERFSGQPDLILFGHSHVPFHETLGRTVLFNPGTASSFALKLHKTYGRIELAGGGIRCETFRVS